jgi:hypothetical protein
MMTALTVLLWLLGIGAGISIVGFVLYIIFVIVELCFIKKMF